MAGTTYNTLNLAAVDEAPKATSTPRVAAVASVIAAVCVMFFAGRVHQGQTALYTHDEVLNVAETCGANQYIGGCSDCTKCEEFEYANGGCTFFKDTFCSYCEPIANCQRTNTQCTTVKDSTCNQCDCNVPVAAWKHETASCFFGTSCVACNICEKGMFQTTACSHDQDTQCQKCKTCPAGHYVEQQCTYTSDTVCAECVDCEIDDQLTLDKTCTGVESNNQNDIFNAGSQTQCKTCTAWEKDDTFVASACTKDADAVVEDCTKCESHYYVKSEVGCIGNTGVFKTTTADRTCAKCTELLEGGGLAGEGAPKYVTRLCDSNKLVDFDGQECAVCEDNQYIAAACDLGSFTAVGSDTVCDVCDNINDCDSEKLRCGAMDSASTCTGCDEPSGFSFGNCCNGDNLGLQCDWTHMGGNCEMKDQSFREREALRNGFDMTGTTQDFVLWCKKQCESFEECSAFEVDAAIVQGTETIQDDTLCSLKNQYNINDGHKAEWKTDKNCYIRPIGMP